MKRMLFLSCKECGHSLKLDAFKCPNCGSTKTTNIKWLALGVISLVIIIGIYIKISHLSQEHKLRNNTSLEYTLNNLIFGTPLTPDFTIKNLNDVAIKDITIQCDELASDGSLIDSMKNTLTVTIPAQGTQSFQRFYMGNISNPSSITCKIISVGT
jgi:RNA polymerase subunit RPABC4/transcription elongation factor Spt4